MNAFTAASAALHRDRHMSVPATITFTPTPGRANVPPAPIPCRGVPSQPEEPADGQGAFGQMARRTAISFAITDLPIPPLKGDAITFNGADYKAQRVETDVEQTTFTLILTRA